jgi:hypothetical protein
MSTFYSCSFPESSVYSPSFASSSSSSVVSDAATSVSMRAFLDASSYSFSSGCKSSYNSTVSGRQIFCI